MIRTEGRLASYGELWFEAEPQKPLPSILVYRQRLMRMAGIEAQEFLSLVNDLRRSEEELWQDLDKSTRYEIRRAQNKDKLGCALYPNPTNEQIDEFAGFFDAFAARKQLERSSVGWLTAAAEAGSLCLSAVSNVDSVLAMHAHVAEGTFARLYQSASCTTDRTPALSQLIGRANRMLHWYDMMELKRLGIARYDWGGIAPGSHLAALQNIYRFKREFGGKEHVYYNWTTPVSMLGRLYLPLRSLWASRRSGLSRRHRTAAFG